MAETRASIQLIVFGPRGQEDLPGVLREVSAAGFEAFEGSNLLGRYSESEAVRLLADAGVTLSGIHGGYGDYAEEERLAANIAFCRRFGVKNLMCSGVADPKSVEGYRESARLFNTVGRRLGEEGLQFNYHNHAWEFEDLGGVTGMEILARETDPAVVKFNIDVFWVMVGGQNPAEFIRRHAERAGYFHFKDGTHRDGQVCFTELGRGDMDLPAAMAAAREVGAEWIVYEQDRSELSAREAATLSRAYLRDVLGV